MSTPDRHTRGRTAPGRLQALDAYLLDRERALVAAGGLFVDVGFGDSPATSVETARALGPRWQVVGVEREPDRVEAARALAASEGVELRAGGFELPLRESERPSIIRVKNVLRGYAEPEVAAAHARLGEPLLLRGLLLEGSAERDGSVLCAHLMRRAPEGLFREALLLHTDFSRGFAPLLFRDWLPRDLRRRVRAGEEIHAFLQAWTEAWQSVRTARASPTQLFAESAAALAARVPGVVVDPELLARGYLLWRPPGGVPA